MSDLLSTREIDAALTRIPGWVRDGETLVHEREVADFNAAVAFVGTVAEVANRLDHHPDVLIHGYNKVRLTVTTHSAGGLTRRDLAFARDVH
jgi:4a-hydroxytetrahydrobiopterin dehydratase